jgi:anti-anti-sigma factor
MRKTGLEPAVPPTPLRPRAHGAVRLTTRTIGAAEVVDGVGELDLATAPSFSVAVADLVRRTDRDLVVDISPTAFIDSTGLSALLNCQRRATRAGLGFAVVCPHGTVRQALALARLEATLNACDDLAAATLRAEVARPRRSA